jgi:hypothetical protein
MARKARQTALDEQQEREAGEGVVKAGGLR